MTDRQDPNLENIIGILINTLALRNFPKGKLRYSEFLQELKSRTLAAFDNQVYPYDALIEELHLPRNPGRNPLFDVWFIYQNYEKVKLECSGLIVQRYEQGSRPSKFDLILEASEDGDQLFLNLTYDMDLFRKETAERYIMYFKRVVDAIVADNDLLISEIPVVTEADKQRVLRIWAKMLIHLIRPEKMAPASYHQERLWFIDRFETGYLYDGAPVYHNIPVVMDLTGDLNVKLLDKSIQVVLDKYSILRSVIVNNDERPFQKVLTGYLSNLCWKMQGAERSINWSGSNSILLLNPDSNW